MAQVNELAFDWLDAPMVRVAAANVPVPRAEMLEDMAIPNVRAHRGRLQKGGELMAEGSLHPQAGPDGRRSHPGQAGWSRTARKVDAGPGDPGGRDRQGGLPGRGHRPRARSTSGPYPGRPGRAGADGGGHHRQARREVRRRRGAAAAGGRRGRRRSAGASRRAATPSAAETAAGRRRPSTSGRSSPRRAPASWPRREASTCAR